MCGTPSPPRGAGSKKIPQNLHTATHLIFWGFGVFWVKKGKKKIGPKMVQNWPKNGKLDDSPNARLVGETCLRAQWCTSHRATSHCAPFSRMCASTYEVHVPQTKGHYPTKAPPEGYRPNGLPNAILKHPGSKQVNAAQNGPI